jgi:hypothetical protein
MTPTGNYQRYSPDMADAIERIAAERGPDLMYLPASLARITHDERQARIRMALERRRILDQAREQSARDLVARVERERQRRRAATTPRAQGPLAGRTA